MSFIPRALSVVSATIFVAALVVWVLQEIVIG